MADMPSDISQHCPGTASKDAGKASICTNCPNQMICASGISQQPDLTADLIKRKLSTVKHKLLVLSGKGGVGKSTITSLISRSLALNNPDINVAVLDIDICGPSQPRVLGVIGEQVHQSGSGWSPVLTDLYKTLARDVFNMLTDIYIDKPDAQLRGMIKQFLSEVDWGALDYLILDTPPGTSDEHLSATSYLKHAGITGVIIITTPQQVALLDVRKEIDFCRKVNIPILGVIENMSIFVCPNCNNSVEIFPALTGGGCVMAKELNVEFLGSLPLDPLLAKCCDEGKNFLTEIPESPTILTLQTIVQKIIDRCEKIKHPSEIDTT
ncbi:Cytosolic Fe-S cluster assembly factor NUBP1 like protein [Melipona quadrifasciata]|uniref:Cytosolic Fe-S cluster assembly factor NUBP1 like protein n=1 Tax=Melipona quadrifasciata TaxID=166423 RepID=A0A0M9A053_9HYME|nr:Cytosolic Fe-S cluster assembly factor NUBP1 like protein [Melipona quadrifasciata]